MLDITKYIDLKVYNYLSPEEQQEIHILYDPKKWAEDRLGWTSRDYQEEFFDSLLDYKQVVLRWGRRLGKSDSMIIAALYHADTQINADPDKGSYRVLIVCPYENQIDAIFERLKVIIENSPKLSDSVKLTHHKATFANGSVVIGKTAGSKTNKGAASLRGQGADLVILDEMDYLMDKDVTNIMQLKKEDPGRIKFVVASTPTGDRRLFYRWCVEAEDLGWRHIHRSSLVSKEIFEVNPDNKQGLTYLEEIKQQLTEIEFLHEVMAEFGDNQRSLFQKRFIDIAIGRGAEKNWRYHNLSKETPIKKGPRILSVDWDKAAASTNIMIMEFNRYDNLFYILNRVEIPSHEFTYTEAISKIVRFNKLYDLDWLFVDRGYGEKQIEDLKMEGMRDPASGLANKVVGIQFSQKIEVRDPHTKQKTKKDVKPFMINNAVNVFEKGMIVLDPTDGKTIKQLQDYAIKSVSASGKPIYTEHEEHIVDCVSLGLLGFEQKYGALFNIAMTARVVGLTKPIDDEDNRRVDAEQKPRVVTVIKGLSSDNKYNARLAMKSSGRITSRRSF